MTRSADNSIRVMYRLRLLRRLSFSRRGRILRYLLRYIICVTIRNLLLVIIQFPRSNLLHGILRAITFSLPIQNSVTHCIRYTASLCFIAVMSTDRYRQSTRGIFYVFIYRTCSEITCICCPQFPQIPEIRNIAINV